MAIARVKIGIRPTDYNGINSLLSVVFANMTLNAVEFPAPNPPLAVINGDNVALTASIAAWGPVHNRGSHAQYLVLQADLKAAYDNLIAEAAYVQNVVPLGSTYAAQAAFIALSGFSVKNLPTPQGLLNQPEDLHQDSSNTIDVHTPYIEWAKPIGVTSPGNVKSYELYRNNANVLPTTPLVTVTATHYLDTDPAILGTTQYYWIKGVNSFGAGAPTASLKVDIPGI